MVKKDDYLSKIDKIPTVSFNKEQKIIAKKILEKTDEKDLDAVYGLITQRVKTGFVFDEAPEVNHNAVAIVKENKELRIDGDSLDCIEHKLIIGENYDALKNLCATYIDKNGKGLIDVIYIDPPYNTEATKQEGNDYKEEIEATKFIYRDKFTRDGWLNMMNERLKLAKQLLSESGVIFISIDDSEQAYLKVLCDEIFGEENFYGLFIQTKGNTQNDSKSIQKNHEYILCYVKKYTELLLTYENIVLHQVFEDQYYLGRDTETSSSHDKLIERNNLGYTIYYYEGSVSGMTGNHNTLIERNNLGYTVYYYEGSASETTENYNNLTDKNNLGYNNFKVLKKRDKILHAIALKDYSVEKLTTTSKEEEIYNNDEYLLSKGYKIIRPPKRDNGTLGCWTWGIETFTELWNNDEVIIKNNKNIIQKKFVNLNEIVIENNKKYYKKINVLPPQSILNITNSQGTKELKSIFNKKVFDNPKSTYLLKHLVKLYNNKNSIILDFFAGSGTTGQAVMELNAEDGGNRQFILVTNNENNIGEKITRERLYRVIKGIGTNGETFDWTYKKDTPYLNKNSVRVFNIETHELTLNDLDKAEDLKEKAKLEFKKLNQNYSINNDFDIYNELSALNPQKLDKDCK